MSGKKGKALAESAEESLNAEKLKKEMERLRLRSVPDLLGKAASAGMSTREIRELAEALRKIYKGQSPPKPAEAAADKKGKQAASYLKHIGNRAMRRSSKMGILLECLIAGMCDRTVKQVCNAKSCCDCLYPGRQRHFS